MTDDNEHALLTPAEAAAFLRVSASTIRRWRREGTGPPYLKLGRGYRYRRDALLAWLREREREGQV